MLACRSFRKRRASYPDSQSLSTPRARGKIVLGQRLPTMEAVLRAVLLQPGGPGATHPLSVLAFLESLNVCPAPPALHVLWPNRSLAGGAHEGRGVLAI